jgi:long-chain acyl-CoA synthetase
VHAVLRVDPGTDPEAVVAAANARLADHQRVRSVSMWPDDEFPRTEGTRKLKRHAIRKRLEQEEPADLPARPERPDSVRGLLLRYVHGPGAIGPDTTLDALGLSSLERAELQMAIEQQFEIDVDEARFAAARTVGDLERLVTAEAAPSRRARVAAPQRDARAGTIDGATVRPAAAAPASVAGGPDVRFPTWSRGWPARAIRRLSLATWILPPVRLWVRLEVHGREHLDGLTGPAIFAANHQSMFDAPTILLALPPRWRARVAVAMGIDFFRAHFHPARYGRVRRMRDRLTYGLAVLFFNAFPLPTRPGGMARALRHVGALVDAGDSLLIFPEGMRTDVGEINAFRPGVGMLAEHLRLPVVPVRLDGLDRVLHRFDRWPRRGRARVAFGRPLTLTGDDPSAMASQVEAAVRALLPEIPVPAPPAVRREAS